MANDFYIPEDSDEQLARQNEEQEYDIYMELLRIKASEHEYYLRAITNDFNGSSVTLMTEFNQEIQHGINSFRYR